MLGYTRILPPLAIAMTACACASLRAGHIRLQRCIESSDSDARFYVPNFANKSLPLYTELKCPMLRGESAAGFLLRMHRPTGRTRRRDICERLYFFDASRLKTC